VIELIEGLELFLSPKLHAAVLTGAGISAESGVPIFRGKGSMWENETARKLAQKARPPWNTRETWEYYEWRRALVSRCQPNAAHLTLVEMENYFKDFA
jgi:NAD-dependent deacetylase